MAGRCRRRRLPDALTIYSYRIISDAVLSVRGASGRRLGAGQDRRLRPEPTRAPGSGGARSQIRPPHTTTGTCHGTWSRRGDPARGQRGGLRPEIAGWDAGTPAFSNSEPAPWRPAPLFEASNSGRKDRESDNARDHSPRYVFRVVGRLSFQDRWRIPDRRVAHRGDRTHSASALPGSGAPLTRSPLPPRLRPSDRARWQALSRRSRLLPRSHPLCAQVGNTRLARERRSKAALAR